MIDLKKQLLNKLPAIAWNNEINFRSGTNDNIIQTLLKVSPLAVKQAQPIAHYFKGKNDLESLKNIHTFIRQNLGYRKDPKGIQQIKMPNRFINESGDCKSNSLFIYAIAKNLGIPIDYKFANYNNWQGVTPSHVYNIAFLKKRNKFVFVDGTSNHFGIEAKKPNFQKMGGLMQIQTLSDNMGITGKGKIKAAAKKLIKASPPALIVKGVKKTVQSKKLQTAVKKVVKKVQSAKPLQKVATGALVAQRSAFLGLVSLNFRGLANKLFAVMSSSKSTGLKNKWNLLGGNYTALQKAVNTGRAKKPLFGGISSLTVAAGTVAAATPILVALSSFIGKLDKAVEQTDKIKNSASAKKIGSFLKKNPTIAAKLDKLKGEAKNRVVEQIAQTTGQSPTDVSNILNEAKETVNPSETEPKADIETDKPNAKKLLYFAGAGLLGYGLYKSFN